MYKIEAIVMMNGHEAFVLSDTPRITFERHGKFLFGLDEHGVFAGSYYYQKPSKSWEAFAGRKFDIPMTDGTIEKAYGQWWDGGGSEFSEAIGGKIISVTASTLDRLKKCYVFTSYRAALEEAEKLRATYTGKIYEYWEYNAELNGRCPQWDMDKKNPKKCSA